MCAATAQTRPQPPMKTQTSGSAPEPVASPSILVNAEEDYRIGPRDVIEVKVADADELSQNYEVRADGTFLMTYLNRVKAGGKTPDELARFIEDGLRGNYLKNPHVSVVVRQFNSHTFIIQGLVVKPGVYQIEGRPSLLKLISVAGGLSENHGTTAFIIRELKSKRMTAAPNEVGNSPSATAPSAASHGSQTQAGQTQTASSAPGPNKPDTDDKDVEEAAEYTVKTVNIAGLLKGRLEQNIFLEPGDTVSIPKADVFYVAGEVNAPGSFPLGDGATLRQALALSQGTTSNAKMAEGVIWRTDDSGKLQEIKIDIGAVMKNKADDVALQANDMIIVPNSRTKTVMNNLLKALGMGTAQRGIYRY